MPSERQTLASAQRTGEKVGGGEANMMSERRENKDQLLEESALRVLSSPVPGTLPDQLSVRLSF